MSDSTISAMHLASLPLANEAVPCVQDGANVQAPAAAFGIPVVSVSAPVGLAEFQTWIDASTMPPTLRMYIGSAWVALYTIDTDGTLALDKPLTLPADPTLGGQAATKNYVDNRRMPGSLVFKGAIDCSSNPNYPAADQGDLYVVGVAGKIGGTSGVSVEVGDSLLCRVNASASDTQAGVGANWTVLQSNIVGAVSGPASATDGDFALFDGTTGKLVKDGALSLDTDATMAAGSDQRVPSQKAVKSAIAGAVFGPGSAADSNFALFNGTSGKLIKDGALSLDTDATMAAGSDQRVPSQKAVKSAITGAVFGPGSAADGNFALFNGASGKLVKDGAISLDTDATMAASSDQRVPSQKAVKSSIGGRPLSTDTPSQGQGWFWDGVSATFKARSNEGQNFFVNPSFDVWQENTSYTFGGSAMKIHIADYWKVGASGSPSYTATRVAGIGNSQYALKCQRTAGQTNTNKVRVAQQFSQAETIFLAGKTVTISFDFAVGANYSPSSGPFPTIYYGTGVDEDFDLHASSPNFATGGGFVYSTVLSQVAPYGSVARIVTPPLTLPSGITEAIFVIGTAVYSSTAAGADDSFTIGNVKIEIGNIATDYKKPDIGDELRRCQRRYWKTFPQASAPVQNAGSATGEHRAAATKAGAAVQTLGTVRFPTMRAAPAVTLFNPAAANAQARDLTAGGDCSSTTAQNVSDGSCEIIATGNASTAVGNTLGVHAVMDARL